MLYSVRRKCGSVTATHVDNRTMKMLVEALGTEHQRGLIACGEGEKRPSLIDPVLATKGPL